MDSPCRNLCALDREGEYCTGCGRTIGEIVHWRELTDAVRATVIARVRDFQPSPRSSPFPPPARRMPP
ncbi:DUF1289 domain-containing protein [Sphingobium lactosutens]|uniref:DUF1289 domain-containing protein n=1 Tax=Sphingobium lactosutens TaxID=522773 RepID=UPI0015B9DDE2|nr:DUF1289 domain-containing protein [Sphingobium lactosutens]NWK94761.1 DUF1289 domain-containing protein [Sphingobium lactosutens]